MHLIRLSLVWLVVVGCPAADLTLTVDATDLPGSGLLQAIMTVPLSAERVTVSYPKWIHGTHAPSGPVQNLAGFTVHDERGRPARWERDPRDPYRFSIVADEGATSAVIALTYIANQPTEESRGVDVVSTADYALINWNCVLLIPDGVVPSLTTCATTLTLPTGWSWAGALTADSRTGAVVRFAARDLLELVDRPVQIGSRIDRFQLHNAGNDGPEVVLHVADTATNQRFRDGRWLAALLRLPREAQALFGGAWYERYDLLLLFDEDMGLEHGSSSVNGMSAEAASFAAAGLWDRELMAHEYVHSWVGKHRRPVGMLTGDFSTVPVQDSLWVYEGLTEYLGQVLAVRSGLAQAGEWRDDLAQNIIDYGAKPGRTWRSLRDTCRSTYLLRHGSAHHAELRRGQDYYEEGALFWLAADLRIRAASGGTRSLDDLARTFFGPQGVRAPAFDEPQLIAALGAIAPADWAGLIHRWIDETGELDHSFLDGSGWRLESGVAAPGELQPEQVTSMQLREATGLTVVDGWVTEVVSGSSGEKAELKVGDFVYSVNDVRLKDDDEALTKAVIAASLHATVVLYACRDRKDWQKRSLTCDKGIHRTRLVRVADEPDGLAPILAPRVAKGAALQTAAAVP